MRRTVLSVVAVAALGAAALAGVPAADAAPSRPAAKAPAAGTLVVRVAGLSAGHPAHVTVAGPKRYSHKITRTTTLRHLKPGTYQVRVTAATAPHKARIYPAQRTLTAHLTSKHGATAAVRYVTVVPATTKALPTRAITQITPLSKGRKLVHVRAGSGLKKGDILAAGVSSSTPHGLLAKVVTVSSKTSVVVTPATLLQAVPSGRLDAQAVLTQANETPQGRRAGLRIPAGNGPISKKVDEPLGSCSHSVSAKASGTVSISPSFRLAASWSLLHGVTAASLTASITQSSSLNASISASGSCSGEKKLFAKPVTFATFVVDVGPVPIVLQPQLQITLKGEAKADAAITTSASQSLTISSGLQWQRGKAVTPIESVTKKLSYQSPTLTASGSVDVSVNPEINLLIDGIGGPEVGLTGGLRLDADINKVPWWTLDGYLAGNVGVTIPLLKFDKRVELARKTWEIAHAPIPADPSIDVSSDELFPWNTDVCGFDTSDAYVDVDGHDFPRNSGVGLNTDWANYGSVDVGDDGTFSASEPVGEVADSDHTYQGVYAGSAYGVVQLNANSCVQPVDNGDGTVTMQWGVNGYSAGTEVDLYINDDVTDSATTDDGGSGGSTVTFDCPDSGDYTWNVEGTDNGHGESNADGDIDRSCTPAGESPAGARRSVSIGNQVARSSTTR